MHQRNETMSRRYCGRIDTQFLTIPRSPDGFLSPVSEKIGAESRRCFGSVVRGTFFRRRENGLHATLPVPLGDTIAIAQLAKQITVPPAQEILRSGPGADGLARAIV